MYNYTIFGQVVSGLNLVNDMTHVALTGDPTNSANVTYPVSPIVVNTETLSPTNPDGVIHVNATQAQAGETSTITVTATDPSTNTSTSQSFVATVAANTNSYTGLTLAPVAFGATQTYKVNTAQTIQLQGSTANSGATLTYAITTQPTHGTLSTPTSAGVVTYTPNAGYQGNDSFQFTVTNPTAKLTSSPKTVNLSTTPSAPPTAAPVTASSQFGAPATIQLAGTTPTSGQAINYAITTQPTKGTLSQLNATTGTVVYTPTPNTSGSDSFQYTVTTVGPPAPGLTSQPATVTVNLVQNPVNTGAVRLIGTVLVVTPPPGDFTSKAKNTIVIKETTTNADQTMNTIQVFVNGQLDINQPQDANVTEIEVMGGKASNSITVDPSVDPAISVTLIGGHGKNHDNVLQAGAGPTLEQAWFGKKNGLVGGTGTNELIARTGKVKFRPTATTDVIFAGMPHNFERVGRRVPPSGTFFKLNKHGKLVAVPTAPIMPDFQDATLPAKPVRCGIPRRNRRRLSRAVGLTRPAPEVTIAEDGPTLAGAWRGCLSSPTWDGRQRWDRSWKATTCSGCGGPWPRPSGAGALSSPTRSSARWSSATGRPVGVGYHARFGGPHAEVVALEAAGAAARGATLYVTLEPCCHYGKTPPCTEAVLGAGIRRVVAAMTDPFPKVAGGGFARLEGAGLEVESGLLDTEARRLNAPYLKRLATGRPYVIAKWAMTLDGKTATASGDSRWISGPASRALVHELRGRMDAILVGIGTALADDPQLTARPPGPRRAARVVLDSCRQAPPGQPARPHRPRDSGLGRRDRACRRRRGAALAALGCDILALPGSGSVPIVPLLDELGRRGMTNLLVEGGVPRARAHSSTPGRSMLWTFTSPRSSAAVPATSPPRAVSAAGGWPTRCGSTVPRSASLTAMSGSREPSNTHDYHPSAIDSTQAFMVPLLQTIDDGT